jgi:hypothetical protein
MESHDLQIEIGKDGKVRVRTEGAKGKSCLEYVKLVQRIVGTLQSQELTAEYYEPDSQVKIASELRQQERRQG